MDISPRALASLLPRTRRPRRWRPVIAASAVTVAALGLAACGAGPGTTAKSSSGPSRSSGAAKSGKRYTVALVPGITTDPFYITMENGAAQEAGKLGMTLTWQGGSAFTPASQTPVLQALLAKSPSALLIAPTDATAMKGPIEQFAQAKIPVISVDTTLTDTSVFNARITSDNTQGGREAAGIMAKLAHGKGQVAVLYTTPGTTTTNLRGQGFISEIKARYPNMSVVATEYDNDSDTTAASQAQSLMLAHPGLAGIFATNLASAEGAGTAVAGARTSGKVIIVGYDAEPKEVQLLKAGTISALVIQQPSEEGSLAVQDAYDILTGKVSQVRKSVMLPNVVATTATASSPSMSRYFYSFTLTNGG